MTRNKILISGFEIESYDKEAQTVIQSCLEVGRLCPLFTLYTCLVYHY